jgi:hypothetical protein
MWERGEGDKPINTMKRIFVPLCEACHRALSRRWQGMWLAGAAAGFAVCGLAALFVPRTEIPLGVVVGGTACLWLPVTCFTAYALQQALVVRSLAVYDPAQPRLRFASGQYQQLFDEANRFVARKRNTLGI